MEEKLKRKKQPPALRKFMHPRNPYKHPPSFKQLSLDFKKFRDHCIFDASGKVYFDFKNPVAVAALTTCLLERDYNLKVDIPKGSLVPTLPLRFNYLLWIEDLLGMIYTKISEYAEKVVGCDIGTGSSAIYPLLGVKNFKWSFIGSENDADNYQSAMDNVVKNNLQNKTCLKFTHSENFFDIFEDPDTISFIQQIKSSSRNIEGTEDKKDDSLEKKLSEFKVDFTMCNPPFFSSEEDMESIRRNPEASMPHAASTGCLKEKVVEGGEILFITNMIQESCKHKDFVRLFSTLIGKQKDVKLVRKVLQDAKVAHYKITEFCQGRTMRWGAVWTFDSSLILENYFSKKEKGSVKPVVIYIPRTQLFKYDLYSAWNLINSWFIELKIKCRLFKKEKCCIGAFFKAYKATWLHQRRKKRQALRQSQQDSSNKRKSQNAEPIEELDCKRIKLDNSDIESTGSDLSTDLLSPGQNLDQDDFDDKTSTSAIEENASIDLGIVDTSTSNSGKNTEHGLDCLLKCNVLVVQNNGVLSVELKHLGGKCGKDSVFQLTQFLKNKLANGPHL